MSPNKSPKKQHPIPERVDFPTWELRFTRSVKTNTDQGQALERWIDKTADYLRHIGDTEAAKRNSLYGAIYRMTLPQPASERKASEAAILKLRKLQRPVQDAVKALKSCGSQVSSNSKEGMPPIAVSRLLPSLEGASLYVKRALMILDRNNMQTADALSYCLPFLIDLHGCEVSDSKALALGRLVMEAHGFSDEDLKGFDDSRKGPAGPRRRKLVRENMNALNWILEMDRQRSNEPSFDPTRWQRQNLPELLRVVELVQERELAEFLQRRVARQQQVAELLKKLEPVIDLRKEAGQTGEHEIGEGRAVSSG